MRTVVGVSGGADTGGAGPAGVGPAGTLEGPSQARGLRRCQTDTVWAPTRRCLFPLARAEDATAGGKGCWAQERAGPSLEGHAGCRDP